MNGKKPTYRRPVKVSQKSSRHKKSEENYSFEEADARVYDHFRHHGFADYPHDKRQQLTRFYHLLMKHQQSDNVTRLVKLRDVAIKHFIDCLMIPKLTTLSFPLLDVGTGPGFPGIPLKIEFPTERIILAEGVKRRVDFLKLVREEMKLKELDIVGRYIDSTFLLPVEGVITRAVEEINQTLLNVSQCLQVGGRVFLMKGPNVDGEIQRFEAELSEHYQLEEDHHYDIPQTPNQRRLLVFKKLKTIEVKPL